MKGDGKNKFYRTLNLNNEEWQSLKHFKKIKEKILKENKKKKLEENNESSNGSEF